MISHQTIAKWNYACVNTVRKYYKTCFSIYVRVNFWANLGIIQLCITKTFPEQFCSKHFFTGGQTGKIFISYSTVHSHVAANIDYHNQSKQLKSGT